MLAVQIVMTVVITIVISYISKNIIEKKVSEREEAIDEIEQFGNYSPNSLRHEDSKTNYLKITNV